jgi:hypothetical protein
MVLSAISKKIIKELFLQVMHIVLLSISIAEVSYITLIPPSQKCQYRNQRSHTMNALFLNISRRFLTYALLLISISWIAYAFLDRAHAFELTRDDHIIQWAQFPLLIAAAFYCLRVVLRVGPIEGSTLIKFGFSIFLFLTLILALEEISWGQRIFDISTPDYIKELNAQNEINFHNHSSFQRYRHWLIILFGSVGLMLTYSECYLLRVNKSLGFFSPPDFLKSAFLLVLLSGIAREVSCLIPNYTHSDMVFEFRRWTGRYTELGELNVSIAAFYYAYYKFQSICLKDHALFANTENPEPK